MRLIGGGAIALVLVALGSSTAATEPEGLMTEVVEPGVERMLEDGTGRDLDQYFDLISIAPDGSIWLPGIGGGLWEFGEPGVARSGGGDQMRVRAIEFAPDGTLWAAGEPNGITSFDGETWTEYKVGFLEGPAMLRPVGDGRVWVVLTLDEDHWIGRLDDGTWTGLAKGLPKRWKRGTRTGIVSTADGALWLGVWDPDHVDQGSLLGRLTLDAPGKKTGTGAGVWERIRLIDRKRGENVAALAVGPDGTLWVLLEHARLAKYDADGWTVYTSSDGVPDDLEYGAEFDRAPMVVTSDGTVWLALGESVGGVTSFDGTTWTRYLDDGPARRYAMRDLAAAADGSVWAVGRGIYRINDAVAEVRS